MSFFSRIPLCNYYNNMPSSYYWDMPTALCTLVLLGSVFLIGMPPIPIGRVNQKVGDGTKLESNRNSANKVSERK